MRALWLGLLVALACGCRPSDPAQPRTTASHDEAELAALALFELADTEEPEERLEHLFVESEELSRRASLGDAIESLAGAGEVRILGTERFESLGRTLVDLRRDRPSGGSADYSVQLERIDESWKITWFAGPDVEWPTPGRRRGPSLTSSAAP